MLSKALRATLLRQLQESINSLMMMIRRIVVVIIIIVIKYHSPSVTLAETTKTIFLGPEYQSNYCSVVRECLKGKRNIFGETFSHC